MQPKTIKSKNYNNFENGRQPHLKKEDNLKFLKTAIMVFKIPQPIGNLRHLS
jgi:hypothetical protein